MKKDNEYYVYVYIDPRNFEEFYYGKGKGNRKEAHLRDDSDTEKGKIIKAIEKAEEDPIVKVIAKNLTEQEAFLVEKTLIWKLGRNLTNISSGKFADKFRPHDTFHQRLFGFDYQNGIYYVNIGEGKNRSWKDCRKYEFLSAGQGKQYSDPLKTLEIGDVIVAYLKKYGYVGIGKVVEKAIRINNFRYKNQSLHQIPLTCRDMFVNSDNEKSEYVLKVEWIESVEKKDAKWSKKSDMFTTPLIKASLQNQKKTLTFLEKEFNVKFESLLLDH
ncbi:MAG: GIY-YIG nuclease family protein [Nanoarchaeota archaeon]|nr:GIY-YIG nuclease family protein [Nanoarchaeota archaeon]